MYQASTTARRGARRMSAAIAGLLALGTLAAGAAHADPSPALDRVSISAGAFRADPKIYLSGETRYGRVETPEGKLDDVTLPRVKADVLIGDRHGISLDYFRFDEDFNPSVSGNRVIDGRNVTGTANVEGKLRLEMARVGYKWWLGQDNDVFGIGVGAAYLRAKVSGSGSATLSAPGLPSIVKEGSGSASDSAYAPVLELAYRHAFSPDLRLFVEASGVKKNGGNLEGHLYDGSVGVEWFVARNVGLVVDYGVQKIHLQRNADRGAEVDLRLTGPSAFVKVRF